MQLQYEFGKLSSLFGGSVFFMKHNLIFRLVCAGVYNCSNNYKSEYVASRHSRPRDDLSLETTSAFDKSSLEQVRPPKVLIIFMNTMMWKYHESIWKLTINHCQNLYNYIYVCNSSLIQIYEVFIAWIHAKNVHQNTWHSHNQSGYWSST